MENYTNQLLENLKKKVYFFRYYLGWPSCSYAIMKSNKGFTFLIWVIDFFSKYTWVIPLKNKKGITIITNTFQKILDKSNCKPNKIWVARGSGFYNRSIKSWLE